MLEKRKNKVRGERNSFAVSVGEREITVENDLSGEREKK